LHSCFDGKDAGLMSSSIIVLYLTKYGSTKRYAEWIAEETGADIRAIPEFDASHLLKYEIVILGSSAYFGRLRCRKFLKKNWHILKEKRTAVFGVTGIPPDDPRQNLIFSRSFPAHIRKAIGYYPLRGAFYYPGLTFVDKLFMSGPRIRFQIRWWLTRDKRVKDLLNRFYSPLDWTSKSSARAMCVSMGLSLT
jgi:menaquinone-dependent protoporphyrinogen IX oxidase